MVKDVAAAERPDRRALSTWTLARLYEMIFDGTLMPGDQVGTLEISQQLGVSRSPVHDAVRQLEEDGLIEVLPTGRRVVARFDDHDVYELYTVRAALEGLAHTLAASRITDEQLLEMSAHMEAMRASAGQVTDFEDDLRFHAIVAEASGIERLERLLAGLWLQTRSLLIYLHGRQIYPGLANVQSAVEDHERILAALRDRDPERASRAIADHLTPRRDELIRAIREHGGLAK